MCPPLLQNWTGALPQSWKEVDELVRDLLPCTNLVRDRMTRPLNFVIIIWLHEALFQQSLAELLVQIRGTDIPWFHDLLFFLHDDTQSFFVLSKTLPW